MRPVLLAVQVNYRQTNRVYGRSGCPCLRVPAGKETI